jgi:hypothetical protein
MRHDANTNSIQHHHILHHTVFFVAIRVVAVSHICASRSDVGGNAKEAGRVKMSADCGIIGVENMPVTLRQQLPALRYRSTIAMSQKHTTVLKNPIRIDDLEQQFATSGVYIIHNTASDRYYIGQAQVVIKRLMDHFSQLSRGLHYNTKLIRDYALHGKSAFVADLLHDMPNSTMKERERVEKKEIERFKANRRKLYNMNLSRTIRITEPQSASQKQSTSSQAHKYSFVEEEDYIYHEMGRCYDCGSEGVLTIQVFECDDKLKRCTSCIEKRLDAWRIEFSKEEKKMNNDGWCFRWLLNGKQDINTQLALAIGRFIEKHKEYPGSIYVSDSYAGPSEYESVEVEPHNYVPRNYIDIPISKPL